MATKPILFNTDMVRAILYGHKTVTRRLVKYSDVNAYRAACANGLWYETYDPDDPPEHLVRWYIKDVANPPYRPGDILYVRETWCQQQSEEYPFVYKASVQTPDAWMGQWRPSIHMPKDAARIFLRVTNVRVERLQEITDNDIVAEGLEIGCYFDELWDSTIKKANRSIYGWAANPWVWVIEFERISKEDLA